MLGHPGDGELLFLLEVRQCRVLEPPHCLLGNSPERKDWVTGLNEQFSLRDRQGSPVIALLVLQSFVGKNFTNPSVSPARFNPPAGEDAGLSGSSRLVAADDSVVTELS